MALFVALALAGTGGAAMAKGPDAQLQFGVKMAKQGLWSEALFRFEQARRMSPANGRVLNNLAVAYEAVGRFEDALATYQEALKLAPGNTDLKRNYSQFLEFYQAFKPRVGEESPPEDDAEAEPPRR